MNDKMKWRACYFMWGVTIAWAVFLLYFHRYFSPTAIEATGVGVVLGQLLAWSTLMVQFWFRKKGSASSSGEKG